MSDFVMPSLGADMDAANLIEWSVKPGDQVHKGDVIAVVETAKGAIEVEVFEDGVVEELYTPVNTQVPVGTAMARIGTVPGDDAKTPRPEPVRQTEAPPATGSAPPVIPEQPAREAAKPSGDSVSSVTRKAASPFARRLAKEQGIDLNSLQGSGPAGAILAPDLGRTDRAAQEQISGRVPEQTQPDRPSEAQKKPRAGFDTAGMRRAIAAAMAKSKREIPHYYLATTIEMTAASRWLESYNESRTPEQRLLLSTLLIRASALALREYPEMNGYYENDQYQPSEQVHVGMAINLRGGGLITPAILEADRLPLPQLMQRLQDLVRRARAGGLRSSEMTSATITVTALGERGVEEVFGVIYPPQVAILGYGKLLRQPWAVNDAIAVRPVIRATLAADHRVSDGHRGALFLDHIDQLLQHPEQL
ncbi:dihydrolipoamide acetyltransferase family protein [Marinobacter sp.]|uniref:dihydrolipoamide acetyltransferase family protein n=1 Tax=Marinobacter sp. TaxID=50741 RepID=UPI00384E3B52